ncbi:MAG: hypothetical protein AAGF82_22370, partial [Pseudomonadota bacterium]
FRVGQMSVRIAVARQYAMKSAGIPVCRFDLHQVAQMTFKEIKRPAEKRFRRRGSKQHRSVERDHEDGVAAKFQDFAKIYAVCVLPVLPGRILVFLVQRHNCLAQLPVDNQPPLALLLQKGNVIWDLKSSGNDDDGPLEQGAGQPFDAGGRGNATLDTVLFDA